MNITSRTARVVNGTDLSPMPEMLGPAYSAFDRLLPSAGRPYFDILQQWSTTIFGAGYVIGLLANILTLAYFIRSRKYRIPIFTLFTSLAVSDMLTCLTACVLGQSVYPALAFPVAAIQIATAISQVICVAYGASVLDLIFLAGLRYYQLCYPLRAKVRVTFTWVMRWCVVMWFVSGILYMPLAFHRGVNEMSYNNQTVKLFIFTGNSDMKNVFESIIGQVLPLVVIATLHLLKLYTMAAKSELTNKGPRNASSTMAALIIVTYIMSIVVRLAHSFSHAVLGIPYQRFHIKLAHIAAGLSYSNSIIDPFIYFFCSAEMRKDFWTLFIRCKPVKT